MLLFSECRYPSDQHASSYLKKGTRCNIKWRKLRLTIVYKGLVFKRHNYAAANRILKHMPSTISDGYFIPTEDGEDGDNEEDDDDDDGPHPAKIRRPTREEQAVPGFYSQQLRGSSDCVSMSESPQRSKSKSDPPAPKTPLRNSTNKPRTKQLQSSIVRTKV